MRRARLMGFALLLLTGLVAIGCLATCILGYQFKLIAKASYGSDTLGLREGLIQYHYTYFTVR